MNLKLLDLTNIAILILIIIFVVLLFSNNISRERYDADPQILYADYRMIPEFPTADHFASSRWPRYNLTSDNDPFSPYYPYYGIAPYFEGGQ